MALRSKYDSQDDIPDALREHYVEKDGVWILQAEGMEPAEEVQALKNAYEREKERSQSRKTEIDRLKAQVEAYADIDPEKAREALARIAELEKSELLDKGNVEELLDREKAKMTKTYEARLEESAKQLAALTAERDKAHAAHDELRIGTEIRDHAAEHVEPSLIRYLVDEGLRRFSLDDDGEIVAMDGETRARNSEGEVMTIQNWLPDFLKENPKFALPNRGGGAPGGKRGADGEPATVPRSAFGQNLEKIARGEVTVDDR